MKRYKFNLLFFVLIALNVVTCEALEQKVVVMRHGQSEHNVLGVYNSNPEAPKYTFSNLTKTGIKQVKTTAKRLLHEGVNKSNVDLLIVSPFPRTLQTAQILVDVGLVNKDNIIVEEGLSEIKILGREG